jgi:hypothetical protein
VFDELTAEEIALLRELARNGGPLSEARLDAEALRTLALRRYAKRLSGFSIVTPEGRRALEALDRGEQPQHTGPRPAAFPQILASNADDDADAAPTGDAADASLNATQEDMLRQLALADAPVPFDDLDGRVVRALEGRALVRRSDGRVEITPAGKAFYETRVRRRRRVRGSWARTAPVAVEEAAHDERSARARSIREAVDALRRAVGGTETIPIEELEAPAEDAFRGFLELADRIERGADPRRISRS